MSIGIKSPGRYVQGRGELANLGKNVKKLAGKFLVVCSRGSRIRVGRAIEESLKAAEKEYAFCEFAGECTKAEITKIMEAVRQNGCDAVIGVGGGKAIDAAKAAAENLEGLPLAVVPTAASNDAPCSGVAVIYNEEGVVIKALITRRNPDIVLVDTDIIANSPKRLLVAGMGDALATWFEARACKNSGARNMARGTCSNTAYMMARLCYDILLKDGAEAVKALERKETTAALENVVEANIYLSGLGWESGGLAVAHAVNDGFAHVPEMHGMYHGEKVAFGTLVQLMLEDADNKQLREVLNFMKAVGLPVSLAELGMARIDEMALRRAAEAACVPAQSAKNLRADITAEEIYEAVLKADKVGRNY